MIFLAGRLVVEFSKTLRIQKNLLIPFMRIINKYVLVQTHAH